MTSMATAAGLSATALASRLAPASRSFVFSSFVVGLLLGLVLLPLIAGCGPPT
jgi:hypothetical protein